MRFSLRSPRNLVFLALVLFVLPAEAGEDTANVNAGLVLEAGSTKVVHWQVGISQAGVNPSHAFIDFGSAPLYDEARRIARITDGSSWSTVFADFLNTQVSTAAKTEWNTWSSTDKDLVQSALKLAAASQCYAP